MIDERARRLFEMQAEICKTLSDTTRLMILHDLRGGEKSVGQLTANLGLPQSNVSHHLAILRERNIVVTRRAGATVHYSLASPKIAQACDLVREVLESQLIQTHSLASTLELVKSTVSTQLGG